jgi:GNAT superfamily N-acetyltransferase
VSDAPETYDEPARGYATVWVLAGLIVAGFVTDLAIGAGMTHLAGWIIAFVVVVGFYAFIVHAVRTEKSLHVSAAALRVGDEEIARAEVVSATAGADDELPVLGWPTGKPRGLKGLTVRLSDGREVVIPSRFPDRLSAVLGHGFDGPPAAAVEIRAVARAELPGLAEIDRRSETVFRMAGYELPELPFDADALGRARAVFVAGRPPVGFVWIDEVDGLAHVAEIAVIPKWMRQGIGGRLLERACEWAGRHGYPAITLTTYADVAWNGPYYASRGFVEISELTAGLAGIREHERGAGLDAVGRRVAMRREL